MAPSVFDMINHTQVAFERIKKDVVEKDRLIEEKNKEILRLKI